MKKIFKGIAMFLLIIVMLLGMLWYLLIPNNPLNPNETLASMENNFDINSLDQQLINNIDYDGNKLYMSMSINNANFKSLLKYILSKSQNTDIQNASFELISDMLLIKYPVKYGIISTRADIELYMNRIDSGFELKVKQVKLGKLPLPSFATHHILNQVFKSKPQNLQIIENKLQLKLPDSGVLIDKFGLESGNINITLAMKKDELIETGNKILEKLLGL